MLGGDAFSGYRLLMHTFLVSVCDPGGLLQHRQQTSGSHVFTLGIIIFSRLAEMII